MRPTGSLRHRLRVGAVAVGIGLLATAVAPLAPASAATACVTAWSSKTTYVGGDSASYQGKNYLAKWWTLNNIPGTEQWGPWEDKGACDSGTTTTPPVTTPPVTTPPVTTPPVTTPPVTTPPVTTPPVTTPPVTTPPVTTPPVTTPPPGTVWTSNPDEKCRPDGLYQTPGVNVPYCTVYDTAGREKLPNGLEQRVIGYFTSWRTGLNGQPRYLASDIPWKQLSHINYAFGHIDGQGKVSVGAEDAGDAATELTWPGVAGAEMDSSLSYQGHFNLLTKYKKRNPGVKTLISVGGWAETGGFFDASGARVATGGFYTLTDTQAKIDTFADSAVAFIRKYGFDGVDIDYEYATSNSKAGNPDDFSVSDARRGVLFKNYLSLMKTLRQKLDAASAADGTYYMLTVAAPASGWLLRGQEVHQVVQYLDYVNMMSYDLHGAWNNFVGGNAPLYDDGKDPELAAGGVYSAYSGIGYLNGDWAYHYFRGALPAGRINLGVPFYTRGWTNVAGGTNGNGGSAVLADQTKCPPGTGPTIGSTNKCGNGAVGIDNLWHDSDPQGSEVPSGVNPIWHVLNLQNGKVGDYTSSYGSPTTITGTYTHHFDSVTKNEWWWNAQTKTYLSGDSDQAIQAKADYVAQKGLGGIMIWELSGDYDYNQAKGQYEMGDTLITKIHDRLAASQPYGASKANVAMPTKAIDLDVSFSEFALGDNNYPINPKVTFTNRSKTAIPAGATITFDTATSDTGALGEQNGWGITKVSSDHTGTNVGGLKGDFHTYTIKVPSGGIPAGGSAYTKLSWKLPMAQISNLRIKIGSETYATLYDYPRNVTLVEPTSGPGTTNPTNPTTPGNPGACTAPAYSASAIYVGGDKVTYNGAHYTAKWWTKGETPGAAQVWGDAVAC